MINGLLYFSPVGTLIFKHHAVNRKASVHLKIKDSFCLFKGQKAVFHQAYVSGSSEMGEWLTNGVRDWVEAAYTVETDIDKLCDLMIERIEEKRTAIGI